MWGVFGDGEMDEPESMSALTLASRERLDNLVWVVNCNLQRLDGPVRSNGKIVDELEKLFRGAGWNVIKLLWGSDWDGIFARDTTQALVRTFAHTVDGQMQTFAAKDGRFNRDNFFGQDAELARLAQGMTDEQIDRLKRGGHDLVKIFAAYDAAARHTGAPTVILAHTKKGYGMGSAGQGKMTTHSQKKLEETDVLEFRNRFNLPITDERRRRSRSTSPRTTRRRCSTCTQARGARRLPAGQRGRRPFPCPRSIRTRGSRWPRAARRCRPRWRSCGCSDALMRQQLGPRIVPIVADEARTFGMANLFKQVGIYSSVGQRYEPEDIGSVLSYREALDGQILEEGISEAGAIAMDGGGHVVQRARVCDAAVLYLLLDVRVSAGGRSDLGGGGPACSWVPAWCYVWTYDVGRRGVAASGRLASDRRDDPELQGVRPGVRRGDGRDHRPRDARDACGEEGCLLLHHLDERELRAAGCE